MLALRSVSLPPPASASRTLRAACILALVAGCGGTPATGYQPFAPVSGSPSVAVVRAAAANGELAGGATPATAAADFAALDTAYQATLPGQTVSLRSAFQAAVDDLPSGHANLGAYLDGQYTAGLALGATGTTANPIANSVLSWATECTEKLPLSYIYYGMVHALGLRTRAGLDTAYALHSFVPDAVGEHVGLYAAAAEYAPSPFTYNRELEALLIEARAHLAANTTGLTDPAPADASYDALLDRIQRKLLSVFANGVHNYLTKLDTAPGVTPDRRLMEGRLFWLPLRGYVAAQNPTRAATITDALYPNGEAPPASGTFEPAYGLEVYADGTPYDGSATAALTQVEALLAQLAAP